MQGRESWRSCIAGRADNFWVMPPVRQNRYMMNAVDGICTLFIRITGTMVAEYICIIAFLAFFFTFVYSMIFLFVNIPGFLISGTVQEGELILMMMGVSLVSFPIALLAEYILKRYTRSHCAKCNRNLACEKIKEKEWSGMYRNEYDPPHAIPFQCRFCGDISYKK